MQSFLEAHPDARAVLAGGAPAEPDRVCPSHPRFVEWLQAGIRWLCREFAIGGVNLENGDFQVCYCRKCQKHQANWPHDEPDFWRHQYLGYAPALAALEGQCKDKLITWATYKGFLPANAAGPQDQGACMECSRPALLDKLPAAAVVQWTLTRMLHRPPLPLTKYLDNGVPHEALANDRWPAALKPPSVRSVGFVHQGSQWHPPPRYEPIVGFIKEACLRAYRAGLEGVSIHGEVSSMHVPWALNYLAFSHFIHWPEDSLRGFGSKTLGQVLGSAAEGEHFAELLAHWDAGSLSPAQKRELAVRSESMQGQIAKGEQLKRYRFWHWLGQVSQGAQDRQTVSFF